MKKYLFSIMCAAMCVICVIVYNIIGSEVLEDGTLSEPFALIPIGYLFAFTAIISAAVVFIVSRIKKEKQEESK